MTRSSEAIEPLEPGLTPSDKKVIRYCSGTARSKWDVAQHIDHEDVADVRRQLDGLVRFGYVYSFDMRRRYKTTAKGRDALKEAPDAAEAAPQEELAL